MARRTYWKYGHTIDPKIHNYSDWNKSYVTDSERDAKESAKWYRRLMKKARVIKVLDERTGKAEYWVFTKPNK